MGEPLKGLRVEFSGRIYPVGHDADNHTSVVDLGSRTVKTDAAGGSEFWRVTVPTADFAQGLSGGMSAEARITADVKKGKRVYNLVVDCGSADA